MPKLIRVALSAEQRAELNRLAHQPVVAPRLRERLETVRLPDLGLTIPQIAIVLNLHQQMVHKCLTAFQTVSFAALPDRHIPGRPPRCLRRGDSRRNAVAGRGGGRTCDGDAADCGADAGGADIAAGHRSCGLARAAGVPPAGRSRPAVHPSAALHRSIPRNAGVTSSHAVATA